MFEGGATPEQAAALKRLLLQLEEALQQAELSAAEKEPQQRIVDTYRRNLTRDEARGLEKLPARELFRAISTLEAMLRRLGGSS